MYEPQLKRKTIMDVTRAKNKVYPLKQDNINKVRKISVEPNHSLEYVASWVNNGLSQLSNEFDKVKDDLPGSVGEKAREYPWVSISLALIAGIFLGGVLMSRRN